MIFVVISGLVGKLDGTMVIVGVVLGLVTGAASLLIATLIAAARRRADPPAAGSR